MMIFRTRGLVLTFLLIPSVGLCQSERGITDGAKTAWNVQTISASHLDEVRHRTVTEGEKRLSRPVPNQAFVGSFNQSPTAASSYQQGRRSAARGDARCVDHFFTAAITSWREIAAAVATPGQAPNPTTVRIYNQSVLWCVFCGCRHKRLSMTAGLTVSYQGTVLRIPVTAVELVWELSDIDELIPASGRYQDPLLARSRRSGLGAAFVGVHRSSGREEADRYFLPRHPMPLTVIIRGHADRLDQMRIEFHEPKRQRVVEVGGRTYPLRAEPGASIELAMTDLEGNVGGLSGFLNPQVAVNHRGFYFSEPFQPDKIPLILVHGLLATPATWGPLINELQQDVDFLDRYQIWVYLYPTATPFIESAFQFREDLEEVINRFDPAGKDPALSQMVLVGHSMGGILSRMQVVWSGNHLWNFFSQVPFDQVRVTADQREHLRKVFFFRPTPNITRVIFIATPHRGASRASRVLGHFGQLLAGRVEPIAALYTAFFQNNPLARRSTTPAQIPASVSGLSRDAPVLVAIRRMPFDPRVRLHAIVGTDGCEPVCPGDGVVPIDSANLPEAESRKFVMADHFTVKHHPESVSEIKRILRLHIATSGLPTPTVGLSPVLPAPVPLRNFQNQ